MSVVITLYVVASLFPENYTTKKRTFRKKRYTDLALRRPQIRICYGSRWKLIGRREVTSCRRDIHVLVIQ